MPYRSKKILVFIYILFIASFFSCKKNQTTNPSFTPSSLTKEIAENLSLLPCKCLQKEYPNKLNQSLNDAGEIGTPAALHPAFYGCYDWHSSVHGHWMLVKLLKRYPDLSMKDTIMTLITQNLSAANIQKEIAYFNRKSEKSYERTYGWAWLLKLQEELDTWDIPESKKLASNLQPLTELLVARYLDFLPKLNYPIRSGEHPNTGFGLALAYDYAVSAQKDSLKNLIIARSKEYFLNDKNCPMSWEPGGFDFLSPCLQEADLMARVLTPVEFKEWIDRFLPELGHPDFNMEQAKVSDRTDGKLVHLDGVNFCRAWSLYRIAKVIPEYHHLIHVANQHIEASLPNIADGGYEGEHWLATFAIYALSSTEENL
jgi:hypothetical protein